MAGKESNGRLHKGIAEPGVSRRVGPKKVKITLDTDLVL
jgi:hypothetical protein